MHSWLVVLIVAWVGGIALGVGQVGLVIMASGTMVVAIAARLARAKMPIIVSSLLLYGLGYLYGYQNVVQPNHQNCSSGQLGVGRVVERPQVREMSVRYVMEDESGCRYMVYAQRWPVYGAGDVVSASEGRSMPVADVAQEQAGYASYLTRQGVAHVVLYPQLNLVRPTAQTNWGYDNLNERVGRYFVEPDAALIRAMVMADRGQLPADIVESWRRAGISHVLSISGLHISLLAGMLVVGLRPLPLPPRWRAALCLALLWGYVWFIGAPVSAQRAGIFWSVVLVAFRLGWLVSLPTALLLAVVIFATLNPALLADVSVQLSVAGVAGIFLSLFLGRRLFAEARGFRRFVGLPLAVSLGAILATWPLVSFYFGIISPVALLANFLVVPVVPLVLAGSLAALATTFVVPSLALLLSSGVHGLIWWMNAVALACARLPGGYFSYSISRPAAIAYYLVIAMLLMVVMCGQGRSWREVWE